MTTSELICTLCGHRAGPLTPSVALARGEEHAAACPEAPEGLGRLPVQEVACETLHTEAGIDLSLMGTFRGRPPVCRLGTVVVGRLRPVQSMQPEVRWRAARLAFLDRHWEAGCGRLQSYAERVVSANETRDPEALRSQVVSGGVASGALPVEAAVLLGWAHAAAGGGSATMLACRACEQTEVRVGEPEEDHAGVTRCGCEDPVFWYRVL